MPEQNSTTKPPVGIAGIGTAKFEPAASVTLTRTPLVEWAAAIGAARQEDSGQVWWERTCPVCQAETLKFGVNRTSLRFEYVCAGGCDTETVREAVDRLRVASSDAEAGPYGTSTFLHTEYSPAIASVPGTRERLKKKLPASALKAYLAICMKAGNSREALQPDGGWSAYAYMSARTFRRATVALEAVGLVERDVNGCRTNYTLTRPELDGWDDKLILFHGGLLALRLSMIPTVCACVFLADFKLPKSSARNRVAGWSYARNLTIATAAGLPVSTVRRHLGRLSDGGWFERKRDKSRPSGWAKSWRFMVDGWNESASGHAKHQYAWVPRDILNAHFGVDLRSWKERKGNTYPATSEHATRPPVSTYPATSEHATRPPVSTVPVTRIKTKPETVTVSAAEPGDGPSSASNVHLGLFPNHRSEATRPAGAKQTAQATEDAKAKAAQDRERLTAEAAEWKAKADGADSDKDREWFGLQALLLQKQANAID